MRSCYSFESNSFSDIIQNAKDGVVSVTTTVEVPRKIAAPNLQADSQFQQFFDGFHKEENQPQTIQSLGSGFVVSKNGYIVTRYSLIKDMDEIDIKAITVVFSNRKTYFANIVGYDRKMNIALLKINSGDPFQPLKFGNSDQIRIGDWVVSMEVDVEYEVSASHGIVSGLHRKAKFGPYDRFIQTNALIKRSGLGGPLLNDRGEVIGIISMIRSRSSMWEGTGLAIPSNLAVIIIEHLKYRGKLRGGWTGMRIQPVTEEIAKKFGLDAPRGALVAGLSSDGPADRAGIKRDDIILAIDGADVAEMRELPRMTAEIPPGKEVDFVVFRNRRKVTVKVVLGELKSVESPKLPIKKP